MRGTHASLDLQQVERLIDFAKKSANAEIGFGHLGTEGSITQDAAPSMLITARMTFTFAIASKLGFSGTAELAHRGIASLSADFYDRENGGFFSIAPGFGDSGRKNAYDTAFVLLAASTAQSLNIPGAATLTNTALEVLFEKFWREDLGIFANSFNQDFSREEPYLGANANMHTVEALISAHAATGDSSLLDRALDISDFMVNTHARSRDWMMPEHFEADGAQNPGFNEDSPADEFRPFGVTIGHLFEWSRLLLELHGNSLPAADWVPDAARSLYEKARSVGWAADGREGFVYTLDWESQPVVTQRLMWVVAEAISAAAQVDSSKLVSDAHEDVLRWSHHLHARFKDSTHGSWHHELDSSGSPASTVAQGKPDAYHLLQALLIPQLPEGNGLLDRISNL
ncbi:AGE family epimerase/isomerase [Pontimonas sp.]|nr:AGE family epimerase/isomerase [Pontimonas sp.]